MSVLDICLLLVFAVAAWNGFRRGIVLQIGALASVVAGVLACRIFGSELARWLSGFFTSGNVATMVAYILLFLVAFLGVSLLAHITKAVVHAVFAGPVDRILGVLFCEFQYFLVVSLLLNFWQSLASAPVASHVQLLAGTPVRAILELAPTVFGFVDFAV